MKLVPHIKFLLPETKDLEDLGFAIAPRSAWRLLEASMMNEDDRTSNGRSQHMNDMVYHRSFELQARSVENKLCVVDQLLNKTCWTLFWSYLTRTLTNYKENWGL